MAGTTKIKNKKKLVWSTFTAVGRSPPTAENQELRLGGRRIVFCQCSFCVWRHQSKIWSTATFQRVPLAVQLWWAVSLPRPLLTPLFSRCPAIKHYTIWFSCPAAAMKDTDCRCPDLGGAKTMNSLLHASLPPSSSANALKYTSCRSLALLHPCKCHYDYFFSIFLLGSNLCFTSFIHSCEPLYFLEG